MKHGAVRKAFRQFLLPKTRVHVYSDRRRRTRRPESNDLGARGQQKDPPPNACTGAIGHVLETSMTLAVRELGTLHGKLEARWLSRPGQLVVTGMTLVVARATNLARKEHVIVLCDHFDDGALHRKNTDTCGI